MGLFTKKTPEGEVKKIRNYKTYIDMIDYLGMNGGIWKEEVSYQGNPNNDSYSPVYNFKGKDYLLYTDIKNSFINKISKEIIKEIKKLKYNPIGYEHNSGLSVINKNGNKENFTPIEIENLLKGKIIFIKDWNMFILQSLFNANIKSL